MKDTEFISQMANIASLEQMQQFSKGFSSFADSHDNMVSQSYLGKYVEIDEGIQEKWFGFIRRKNLKKVN